MSRRIVILDVAQPDFREIRTYVKSQFGNAVWTEVNTEFKTTINSIGLNPEMGTEIEELKELGQKNFKTRLVRQTKIIYEYDDTEVLIHMFIHARRDFRTHLMKRLLNA